MRDTVRLENGSTMRGRLIAHLGNGRIEVEQDGRRYVGVKLSTDRRRRAAEADYTARTWMGASGRV